MCRSTPTTAFNGAIDALSVQYRHIEHVRWIRLKKKRQNDSFKFPYMAFVYAWIVPSWADQLLPQLLMEQFVSLPIQCRYIEHMHEGVCLGKNNF